MRLVIVTAGFKFDIRAAEHLTYAPPNKCRPHVLPHRSRLRGIEREEILHGDET